jgi:hypothetical protein
MTDTSLSRLAEKLAEQADDRESAYWRWRSRRAFATEREAWLAAWNAGARWGAEATGCVGGLIEVMRALLTALEDSRD